jgi:hypothetical protein
VLVDAFASLVLGFSPNIGAVNQSVLVWFLVLFPVIVFAVFAWLVTRHHKQLYPPGAFKDETNFLAYAGIPPYGEAAADKPGSQNQSQKKAAALAGSLKTSAIGNIYWLGHDLMWTADVLLRGGSSKDVLIGLDQAQHHLGQVGLEQPQSSEISRLRKAAQDRGSSRPNFGMISLDNWSMIDRIGMTVETAQGDDFKPPPWWNRVRN